MPLHRRKSNATQSESRIRFKALKLEYAIGQNLQKMVWPSNTIQISVPFCHDPLGDPPCHISPSMRHYVWRCRWTLRKIYKYQQKVPQHYYLFDILVELYLDYQETIPILEMESHPAYPYFGIYQNSLPIKTERVSDEILVNYQSGKRVKMSVSQNLLKSMISK